MGPTLHATLLTLVDGTWTYQAVTFGAAPGVDTFTYPTDGRAGVTSGPITWTTIPAAQGHILVVGTSRFGTDLVNSGILDPGQSNFAVPALPAGKTLYATLLTKTAGAWTRYQSITFTSAPVTARFTYPAAGQARVDTTKSLTWTPVPAAQGYALAVGTTKFGTDLVSTGVLPIGRTSYLLPAGLPTGKVLDGTLLTLVNGTWTYQAIVSPAEPG